MASKKRKPKVKLAKRSAPSSPREDALSRAAREQQERERPELLEVQQEGGALKPGTPPKDLSKPARMKSLAKEGDEAQHVEASSEGLEEVPVAEGSSLMTWRTVDGSPMTNAQLLFASQEAQKDKGKRYIPPPPPPKEIDPVTKLLIERREAEKQAKKEAHFAALREKRSSPEAKEAAKQARRQKRILEGKRVRGGPTSAPKKERKPADPNAPRPENPYREGSIKHKAFAILLKLPAKERTEAVMVPKIVELGAAESSARGWLKRFMRYLEGGEK